MNALTISFVLVRLAAVFLFVRAVQGLAAFSYMLTGDAQFATFGVVTIVFMVALPAAVAIVLWAHPEKVTGAQVAGGKSEGPISADQVLLIGVSLLGLYLTAYGILDLFQIEADRVLQQRIAEDANWPNEQSGSGMIARRVSYFAQIVLGLLMLAGRRGLSRLLLKAKYGAVPKSPEDA